MVSKAKMKPLPKPKVTVKPTKKGFPWVSIILTVIAGVLWWLAVSNFFAFNDVLITMQAGCQTCQQGGWQNLLGSLAMLFASPGAAVPFLAWGIIWGIGAILFTILFIIGYGKGW